ncbi:MAG: trypsin-like peptidase domain-containing protein [Bacteroidetes bacterium]|nr:trypsin-like peptidase domain-containing protein [Bacteroidota bacterium]
MKNKEFISSTSGVFISNKGYLVTNFHVLEGIIKADADYAFIKNEDKFESLGNLVCFWEEADLAIFKISPFKFPGLKIDDSNTLNVGSKVYTISSPIGIENTFSEGMVSKLQCEIPELPKLYTKIHTTANYTHGSSGGALLNEFGELVGILQGGNETKDGVRANINWAIPIVLLRHLIQSSECKIEKDPFKYEPKIEKDKQIVPVVEKPKGLQENPSEVNKD